MASKLYGKKPSPARFVFCLTILAFFAGVVPDIDHAIYYWLGIGENGRFLYQSFHDAGVILLYSGVFIFIAQLCRRAFVRFLRRDK